MKRIFTILAIILLAAGMFAQSPEKMSYQAVIRNSSNALVTSSPVGMRISIIQGTPTGTTVYQEIYNPNPETNANGLITIEVGGGLPITGSFSTIDWSSGPYFIKTETDPTGGTNYTITGTSQILSVPYALHAKTAETVTGTITESDPVYSGSQAANITVADITNLGNLSGVNTGDQDLSGYLTGETDPRVPTGTQTGEIQYWDGSEWVILPPGDNEQFLSFSNGEPVWVNLKGSCVVGPTDAYNPTTGKIWMDRNLGASQVATSVTDAAAYGDLYQWGRINDGHQIRTSGTTTTLSLGDITGHSNFITVSSSPYDWRSPQNNNLWQGLAGVNNPCPSGYRLPTEAEWEAERQSWSSNNAAGAFASPLKLTLAGYRLWSDGSVINVGSGGLYWSSTVNSTGAQCLSYGTSGAGMSTGFRANGYSVRCIKD